MNQELPYTHEVSMHHQSQPNQSYVVPPEYTVQSSLANDSMAHMRKHGDAASGAFEMESGANEMPGPLEL